MYCKSAPTEISQQWKYTHPYTHTLWCHQSGFVRPPRTHLKQKQKIWNNSCKYFHHKCTMASRASKLFTANGHTRYCGLVRGPQVKKVTVSGTPNCLNYCVFFMVYRQFTSVGGSRTIQPGGLHATLRPWAGDPWCRCLKNKNSSCSSDTRVWVKRQISRKRFGADNCNFESMGLGPSNSYTWISTDLSIKKVTIYAASEKAAGLEIHSVR
jgi:hypothetical protein